MFVCKCFVETSQMIVAVHHTYVYLLFEHRSKAIGLDVEDSDV